MFTHTAPTTFALPHQPEYEHTQWAPLYLLLMLPGLIVLLVAASFSNDPVVVTMSLVTGGVLAATAYCFRNLRIVDEGDKLALRFGPLPIFHKRVLYANIKSADEDRTTLADGWGIHWTPGRGWTYNLWGFDCVRLTLANGRTIRVGTDDPGGLARFLRNKIET